MAKLLELVGEHKNRGKAALAGWPIPRQSGKGCKGCGKKIVYTPAKIVRPKHAALHPLMRAMLASCRTLAAPRRLEFRGGSWRLPGEVAARHTVAPLLALCRKHNVRAQFCKAHLLATR